MFSYVQAEEESGGVAYRTPMRSKGLTLSTGYGGRLFRCRYAFFVDLCGCQMSCRTVRSSYLHTSHGRHNLGGGQRL